MTGISGDGLERAAGANVNHGLGLEETSTVSRKDENEECE